MEKSYKFDNNGLIKNELNKDKLNIILNKI